MPRASILCPSAGAQDFVFYCMIHPSYLIRYKGYNTWQKERVEGLVMVRNEHHVVWQGSLATNAFIMMNL